jgi:hypothetical protein
MRTAIWRVVEESIRGGSQSVSCGALFLLPSIDPVSSNGLGIITPFSEANCLMKNSAHQSIAVARSRGFSIARVLLVSFNEMSNGPAGEIPLNESTPELWIQDDQS